MERAEKAIKKDVEEVKNGKIQKQMDQIFEYYLMNWLKSPVVL